MSAPPRVSVVVPTYNRAPLLRGALATVAAQTFPAWECLVCDDGSSDGTLDLVREIARGDPRFRLVPGPRFGLPAGPRNRGIRAAHAPWVAFLDDDDVWHPRKLEHQVWALEREPADAVSARYRAFRGDTPPPFEADDGAPRTLGRIGLAGVLLHHPPFPATPSNIIARSALLELGGFDESTAYRAVEDLDLWSRLLSRPGFRWLAVEGMPLLAYRELGSDSISAWDHTLEPDVIRQRWAILEIMGRIIRGRPALGTAEWRALIAAMRDRADDCAARCRAVGWRDAAATAHVIAGLYAARLGALPATIRRGVRIARLVMRPPPPPAAMPAPVPALARAALRHALAVTLGARMPGAPMGPARAPAPPPPTAGPRTLPG